MNAVTLINQQLDVEKLLKHYNFDKIQYDNDIIRACCKIHDGNNKTAFVINRDNGLWYCHTGNCGGGDVFTLVQKMENIDFYSSVRWLSNFFKINITDAVITERKIGYIEELKKFIKIMNAKKKKEIQPFEIPEKIMEVTKYRKFHTNTLEHFKLGYVESVKLNKRNGECYMLRHRLAFPILFNNIQIGISFRKIKPSDVPKWSHQPAHIETKEILYNYDNTKFNNIIVICEGITDVWAFYEIGIHAVATLGAHITQEQYKLLLKTGADLVFAFDGDEAGQIVTQYAIKLFKYKANTFIIKMNNNEDPESIEREELKIRYDNKYKV